jgi:hypothetical protein
VFSLCVNNTLTRCLPLQGAGTVCRTQGTHSHVPRSNAFVCCLRHWLRKWKVVTVTKGTDVKAARRIQKDTPVQLQGQPIQRFETFRCLGVNLDAPLIWSAHINQLRKKARSNMKLCLNFFLTGRANCP